MHGDLDHSAAVDARDSRRTEWHALWIALSRREWSSLAVVPASPSDWPLRISRSLTRIGALHRGGPVQLVNAVALSPDTVRAATTYLEQARDTRQGVIVACPSPIENETAIPVIRSADAVLLTVVLGESTFRGIQQLMDLFAPRIIGSVVVPGER